MLKFPQKALSGTAQRLWLAALLALCAACSPGPDAEERRAVLSGYRQLAYAVFSDSHTAATELYQVIDRFLAAPDAEGLEAARAAWRRARVPYSQAEALRFGNWFVDEWETRVNSWPLDEGFIDYVDDSYLASTTNPWARSNIIESDSIDIKGRQVPLHYLVSSQLQMLETASDVESIVVTGYHAIEFMLWGQDRHGNQPGAGERPWTDFSTSPGMCTNGDRAAHSSDSCRKRGEFLRGVTLLLVEHLREMRERWRAADSAGQRLVSGPLDVGLSRMLFGLSTMAAEELAGERMQVALMTLAPEEEQDCFSDNTHNSLWFNALGIENFYYGRYRSPSSAFAATESLAGLAARFYPQLAQDLDRAFAETKRQFAEIRRLGENGGQHFDQLIAADNEAGHRLLQAAIAALQEEARLLAVLADRLGLTLLDPASFGNDAV